MAAADHRLIAANCEDKGDEPSTNGPQGSAQPHTPGPWQIRDDYTADGRVTIIGNVDGEYVDGVPNCTFDVVAVCADEFGESLSNVAANVQLIAAAPELLSGAIALIKECWNIDAVRNTTAMRDLRAAIAKAEGRS